MSHEFSVGERVVFLDKDNPKFPSSKHMTMMGKNYVLLNAKDEHGAMKPITGVIGKVDEYPSGKSYYLYPDGWDEEWGKMFPGFEVDVTRLRLARDGEYFPVTVTNGLGEPIL